jgi:hypothetical protein
VKTSDLQRAMIMKKATMTAMVPKAAGIDIKNCIGVSPKFVFSAKILDVVMIADFVIPLLGQ